MSFQRENYYNLTELKTRGWTLSKITLWLKEPDEIRKEFKEEINKHYWKPYFWSPSYCLISVGGASIEIIREYIRNQDKPKQ